MFGGSVTKHIYVDGLSDIDCLLVVNDTSLEHAGPKNTLVAVKNILSARLMGRAEVVAGRLAVTVQYGDGMEIQLLPAIRSGDRTQKIPIFERQDPMVTSRPYEISGWSNEI